MLGADGTTSNLIRFLDQKAPDLAGVARAAGPAPRARHFEHFLELILTQPGAAGLAGEDPVLAQPRHRPVRAQPITSPSS